MLLIVFLASVLSPAQDHSGPQVLLAKIGVVVTDKSGRPVKDLRQEVGATNGNKYSVITRLLTR